MNDTYVLAQRLHLNGKLYEVGEEIAASAFTADDAARALLPKTPEQVIEELRAADVLKLPLEMQRADDLQAQLAAKNAELAELQNQLAQLQQQAAILPATTPQKKGALSRTPDSAPASESAPLSE